MPQNIITITLYSPLHYKPPGLTTEQQPLKQADCSESIYRNFTEWACSGTDNQRKRVFVAFLTKLMRIKLSNRECPFL